MVIDETTQTILLYDFYGQLLTERQQQVMQLYHEENLSLGEIADEFDISRQGVHDALKNAEKALVEYERKLRIVEKFQNSKDVIERIEKSIDNLICELESNEKSHDDMIGELKNMRNIIDRLED